MYKDNDNYLFLVLGQISNLVDNNTIHSTVLRTDNNKEKIGLSLLIILVLVVSFALPKFEKSF